MKLLLVLITSTIVLFGCATTEKYGQILDSWVGSYIGELTNSWGYPEKSFDAPNGNKVYVYSNSGIYTKRIKRNSTYVGNSSQNYVSAGYTKTLSCTTYIEIDSSGKIVSWRWEGNSCAVE